MSKLLVGLAQLNSNDDVARNIEQIISLIDGLAADVDIVFFPENSLYFRIDEKDPIQYFSSDSQEIKRIAQKCAEKKLYVHLGSVPLMDNGVPSNSSILVTPGKKVIVSYSKIHLFDIQLNQEKAIRESDCFRRGGQPVIFKLKGWRIGQSICYDIRFSELFRFYSPQK